MESTKQQPDITLFRGGQPVPEYAGSPFAAKLEARLRLGGVKYKLGSGSPKTGPRGKIPYISIAQPNSDQSPELMADSTLIASRLIEDGLLEDLNEKLSPTEKAYDTALRALLEEKLYFYSVYEKWYENYYAQRDTALAALPMPVRFIVGNLAYRSVTSTLYGQGTMRFSGDEIQTFRIQIWDTIHNLLIASKSKGKFSKDECYWALSGEGPTEFDATLYGFISSGLVCVSAPATNKIIRARPILYDYATRIHQAYFPDFKGWR